MKRTGFAVMAMVLLLAISAGTGMAGFGFWGNGEEAVQPVNGAIAIPIASISDGAAHHFKVQAADGTMVRFFTLKSNDGVIRAAIDACDVCYRAGKGYAQSGEFMVCLNCGQRFHSSKINVIKGGCNPAPLERKVVGDKLMISMADINANSWYMKYRK